MTLLCSKSSLDFHLTWQKHRSPSCGLPGPTLSALLSPLQSHHLFSLYPTSGPLHLFPLPATHFPQIPLLYPIQVSV